MQTKMFKSIFLSVCSLFILAGQSLSAQPFIDQVPAEASFYISWKGTNSLSGQYQNSNLKLAANAFEVDKLKASVMSMVNFGMQMSAEAPDKEAMDIVQELANYACQYETAMWFSIDVSKMKKAGQDPMVSVDFACKAGGEAGKLAQLLKTLSAKNTDPDAIMETKNNGGTVTFTIKNKEAVVGRLSGKKLSASPAYQSAKKDTDQAMFMYVDFAGLMAKVEKGMSVGGEKAEAEQLNMVMDTIGLGNMKSVYMSGGFNGANWSTSTTLNIPKPRQGVMKLVDQKKLEVSDLKAVPAQSSWVYAMSLDPAQVWQVFNELFQKIEPQEHLSMQQQLASLKAMMQIDVEKDVINAFGNTWMLFSDVGLTQKPIQMSNVWIVNKAKNADALNGLVNRFWPMGMMAAENDPTLTMEDVQISGVSAKKITKNGMSIFFLVHKGHIAISYGAESAKILVDQLNGKGQSIADAANFKAITGRMGQMHTTQVHYADIAAFWKALDPMLRMGMGLGQMQLMQMNPQYQTYVLPPMENLLKPFSIPVVEMTYVDNSGVHRKAIEPFPGASMISPRGILSVAPSLAGFWFQMNMGKVQAFLAQ